MKSKIFRILVLSMVLLLLYGTVTASAFNSYDTYTYSIDGLPMQSPSAYSASVSISSYGMNLVTEKYGNKPLSDANDLFADHRGYLYIADKGNDRIVITNQYYKTVHTLDTYVDEFGEEQHLSAPEGVYVTNPYISVENTETGNTEDFYIYVCDTGNSRVVVFDRNYEYYRTITCPQSPLITTLDFVPSAIAVDKYGRIFIISLKAEGGIIVLSGSGEFTGYIGAQKVTYSVIDMIWRRFQTEEQKAAQSANISVAYNNITVDDDGFVYATSDKVDETKQLAAIKSKSPDFSPVKKLNSMGNQIMKRNGFFDPGGEVDVFYPKDVSKIRDVALGPEGSWTILDYRHAKFFTYDQNGNLLFAFGKSGDQLGNGSSDGLRAITYQQVDGVTYLIALDKSSSGDHQITVYSPTEYCDTIISALHNENSHLYSATIDDWNEVLTRNNNFDLAYIGIGKALYSQGKFSEAQDALANAYEVDYASKAFKEARKDIIGKWILPILIVAIALIVVLLKFLGYAKKKNKATSLKVGRKTYGEELLFVFHLIFHPFDGFWDLKHEKRGSVRAATTFLGITIVAFFYNSIGKGYLFNPRGTSSTPIMAVVSVLLPVILWAVSNWCLTTLFDGEGSFKDIYIATCYSLIPMAVMLTASTLLTNVLSGSEATIVTLVSTIGIVWSLLLIFFGMLVTHDYSLGKNLITMIGTVVAMLVIMFVAVLFSSLLVKMVSFITNLFGEIANRI